MPPVPCSDQPALRKPAAHQSPRLAFSPQRQEGISPVRTEVRVGCVLQDTCRAVSAALGISGLPQIGQSGLVRRPPGLRRNVTRAKTRSRRVGVDQRHQRARFCKRGSPTTGSSLALAGAETRVGSLRRGIACSVSSRGGWLSTIKGKQCGMEEKTGERRKAGLVIPVTGDWRLPSRASASQWRCLAPEPPVDPSCTALSDRHAPPRHCPLLCPTSRGREPAPRPFLLSFRTDPAPSLRSSHPRAVAAPGITAASYKSLTGCGTSFVRD